MMVWNQCNELRGSAYLEFISLENTKYALLSIKTTFGNDATNTFLIQLLANSTQAFLVSKSLNIIALLVLENTKKIIKYVL